MVLMESLLTKAPLPLSQQLLTLIFPLTVVLGNLWLLDPVVTWLAGLLE